MRNRDINSEGEAIDAILVDSIGTMDAQYDTSQIQVLSGLQAIRLRPGMYVGPVDEPNMFNRLVQEALCLSIDEIVKGHCSEIQVTISADKSVSIRDNGRGLSMVPNTAGDLLADNLFGKLHACRDHKEQCEISRSCCEMGIIVVNALSTWFRVRNFRDGFCWLQEYKIGDVVTPFTKVSETTETGLELSYMPDSTILTVLNFNAEKLIAWVNELKLGITLKSNMAANESFELKVMVLSAR